MVVGHVTITLYLMRRSIADVWRCFAEVSAMLSPCFGDNSHIKRKPKLSQIIGDHRRSSAIISEESAIIGLSSAIIGVSSAMIGVSSAMIGNQIDRKEVLDVTSKTSLQSIAPKFKYLRLPMGDLNRRTVGEN